MRHSRRAFLAATGVAMIAPAIRVRAQTATPAATPSYAHPEWLIEPAELHDRLDDPSLKVIALTPAKDFAAGHIPGAVQIDWPDLEIVETGDQQIATWRSSVEQTLTRLGIATTDEVVVYDGGTFYAARLWWVLFQLGHRSIRILNGGLPAWTESTLPADTGAATPSPAANPYVAKPDNTAIATLHQVYAALGQPGFVLIDARTPDEYAAGHIPGAINIPFTENAVATGPKRWKSAADLAALYASAGVSDQTFVIPYCSTGVRSAATYFALRLIGHDRASLFTGSFDEWSRHPELPVTSGANP
jgi:thiosulfate/3-mercaptopyruvate sulfurtransferase